MKLLWMKSRSGLSRVGCLFDGFYMIQHAITYDNGCEGIWLETYQR